MVPVCPGALEHLHATGCQLVSTKNSKQPVVVLNTIKPCAGDAGCTNDVAVGGNKPLLPVLRKSNMAEACGAALPIPTLPPLL
jgi:hypothetical protein